MFGKLLRDGPGSLGDAGAALLVCRAGGARGRRARNIAVPESLQPLFAAEG